MTYHGVPSPNLSCMVMNCAKTPSSSEPATRMMRVQKLSWMGGQKYRSRTTTLSDTNERAIVVV